MATECALFNSAFKDIENCTHTLNGEPEGNTEFPQNLTNQCGSSLFHTICHMGGISYCMSLSYVEGAT